MKSLVEKILEAKEPEDLNQYVPEYADAVINNTLVSYVDAETGDMKTYKANKKMMDGVIDIYTRYMGKWKVPVWVKVAGTKMYPGQFDKRKNGYNKFQDDFYRSPEGKELEKWVAKFGYEVQQGVTWGINIQEK